MKMKKFGAIVLAGLMAVSLVGCGGNSSSKNEEKTYIIATDKTYPPFEMEDDSGKLVGVDMDLIRAIAKDQKFKIKINSLGFDAACTALESGEADGVIAGMSINDERKQKYDFSLNCKMKLELRNWDKGACPFIPIRAAAGPYFQFLYKKSP